MNKNNNDRQAAPMHDGLVAFPSSVASSPTTSPFLVSLPTSSVECTTTQQRETPKAAAAFHEYALMGPDRSLAKLAESWGKNKSYVGQLQRWSSQFHWQDRVRQYDAQEAEKRRKKRQQELEKMDEEHALIGRTHLLRAVTAMEPQLKEGIAPFPSLVSLFKYSAELERLARGAATSRLEGDITVLVQPKEYIGIDEDAEGSEP